VSADLARVDESVFHPLLELRLADRKKFAGPFEIHVSSELVDPAELTRNGISHSANKHVVWNL
jgi:hypothetical protein